MIRRSIILLVFTICGLFPASRLYSQADSLRRQYVLIADIQVAKHLAGISVYKVEAALNLACELSGKYRLVPLSARDSIVEKFSKEGKEPTVALIAGHLKVDRIIFLDINSIGNMLRVSLSGVNTRDSSDMRGTGYSQIRYREEKTNKVVYDPTLLAATQRAFADMEKDSLMYDGAEGGYRVFPAKTLVIGGIEFQDDTLQRKWDLFEERTVVSYDAIENIFQEAFKSSKYVVYDTDTRDSIYSYFKLFLVENFNPPNKAEIEALSKFEVDYYLTGVFKRVSSGAIIEMYLCSIIGTDLHIIKKEMDVLANDSKVAFAEVMRKMTKKLLEIK